MNTTSPWILVSMYMCVPWAFEVASSSVHWNGIHIINGTPQKMKGCFNSCYTVISRSNCSCDLEMDLTTMECAHN